MTATIAPFYTPTQDALIARFLERNYTPVGYRAQVMVGHPTIDAFVAAATTAVVAAGTDPARRVAIVHPRPGEDAMREVDVIEYFRKYGHEYCAALMSADAPFDIAAITAAARAVGCVILWDVSTIAGTSPTQLTVWGVDAAVSTTSDYEVFEAI